MKNILLPLGVVAAVCVFGFIVVHCGGETTEPECKSDSDCPEGQACIDGVCVGAEVCDPPCDPEVEFCFGGECVPIGNPSNKDGDGYLVNEDCDDLDWTINPGATEYCDGVDNNCDTNVDEGCHPCADGDTKHCGTDVGECIAGTQTCQDGRWGPCEGSTGPAAERCDGKDNDCDGLIDEICPCTEGATLPCGTDVGECSQGTQVCENGAWSGCQDGATPEPEICDGLDNDCDGASDDGFMIGAACDGAGECAEGAIECGTETSSICSTEPGGSRDQSRDEVCDGLDDDCDGETDEGFELGQECAGRGECVAGTWECAQDGGRVCSTGPGGSQDQSQDELCDGLDDDCDGLTDEDYHVGEACDGTGSCGAGQIECASVSSARCSTEPGGSQDQSRTERCDGQDDDCDGSTDEDFMVAGDVCGACGVCNPATGSCQADDASCIGNCDYCSRVSDINYVCAPVEDGCGSCGACTGSGNSFNCQADSGMCTGNCVVCSGSGTEFNCAANDGDCTGNCAVCSGSGTEFNCAANQSACTGDCGVCQGTGASFNCAGDDSHCSTCEHCSLQGTSSNCTDMSTTWGDNLYGCLGTNNRCDLGSCVTCGGYVYDDGCGGCAGQGGKACWYHGSDNANCTTVCGSHGGCIEANWNDDTSCSVQMHFTTCNLGCNGGTEENSPIPAHMVSDPPWTPTGDTCAYRTGGSQSCGASLSLPSGLHLYRVCVCDH